MNKMNRYALIAALAMFLFDCVAQREPALVEKVKPVPERPTQPQQPVPVVPTVPGIPQQPGPVEHEGQTTQPTPHQRHYGRDEAMQLMVGKMLQANDVKVGGILLVDSVSSRTNGSLGADEATETLRNALANSDKFTLISTQQLTVARQQLGLLPSDSLGTRNKAIGIARNVGVQYVLYPNALGSIDSPVL